MGQKILVRLRPPFSPDTFLLEEDVVQTMLHEVMFNPASPINSISYYYISIPSSPIMFMDPTMTNFINTFPDCKKNTTPCNVQATLVKVSSPQATG